MKTKLKRRISFFAGPGAGKSTMAARTFGELKLRGFDVEHIPEYVKTWAYMGQKPQSYDQLYIFSKQLHAEDVALRHVEHVVTDSPVLMNAAYAAYYGFGPVDNLIGLSKAFDQEFPSLNFFIGRTVPYVSHGRYQDEKQAQDFDRFLMEFLVKNLSNGDFHITTVEEYKSNLDFIVKELKHGTDS